MRIGRKKWIPLAAAGFLIILLLALYFIAAQAMNSQWARSLAKTEIDKALGGTVQFEETSLEIFPRLCLRISSVTFNKPGLASGVIKSIKVCPRLWPLIKGDFLVAHAIIEEPDVTTAPYPRRQEEPFSPEIIRKRIIPALVQVASRSPGVSLHVTDGKLNVQRAERVPLAFTEINMEAGITQAELSLDLAGSSSLWGRLLVKGRFPFAEDRLAAKDLTVAAGNSSLAAAEASLTWEDDEPVLLADISQAGIDLKNMQDWGVFSELEKGLLKDINSLDGRVILSSIHLQGPLLKPSAWDYSLSGDLDRVAFHTVIIPQPVKMDAGRFSAAYDRKADPERTMEVIDIQGSIGGSSFKDVSVLFKGAWFKAEAAALKLDLSEIEKWRAFKEFRGKNLAGLRSLTGSVRIVDLEAEGPLESPAKWKYGFSGSVDNVICKLSGAPYPLEARKGDFGAKGSATIKNFSFAGVSGKFGRSSISGLTGKFRTDGTPRLEMRGGQTRLSLHELKEWEVLNDRLGPVRSVEGSLVMDFFRFAGDLPHPQTWTYAAAGTARNVILDIEKFPRSKLEGKFSLDKGTLSFENARASLLDTSLSLTGAVRILENRFNSAAFDLSGTIGRETLTWASQYQPVPEYVKIPESIAVRDSRLEWKSSNQFSLKGVLTPAEGPRIALDLARTDLAWNIRELQVKDALSDARLALNVSREGMDFSFSGSLHKKTVDALLINELEENAFVSGKLTGHIPGKDPLLASATGRLKADNIFIPVKNSPHPVKVHSITVQADTGNYVIESAALSWGNQELTTNGSLKKQGDSLLVDLRASTDIIVYERLQAMIMEAQAAEREEDKSKPSRFWELPLRGNITISSDQFVINKYIAKPFSVDIFLGERLVRLNFTKDFICGMPLPGTIDISPEGTTMMFRSAVKNMDLAPVLACLMEQQTAASGSFDFQGKVTATGEFSKTATGEFTFTARKGFIYRARLLSSILEYLNITRIFLGRLPTIGAEGLPYRYFAAKGRIKGSTIEITEFELRGPTLGLVGEGSIDLDRNRVEFTMLVSPLRTVDYLISRIPIVKYFFKGILAIPVGVYGNPSNPIIVPLDPSAIGAQLFSIMERIITAPLKLFESFSGEQDEKKK